MQENWNDYKSIFKIVNCQNLNIIILKLYLDKIQNHSRIKFEWIADVN